MKRSKPTQRKLSHKFLLLDMAGRIDEAFNKVERGSFVPESMRLSAGADTPLPIGYGQTISQPSTVRMMLEWLGARLGDKVLDIGSGSGWTTALLAYIVGQKGEVHGVEIVPELVERGAANCQLAGFENVYFYQAGNELGLVEEAPFDRILVSAAADEFPEKLLSQLKPGGKLVVPVREDILEVIMRSVDDYNIQTHSGFIFVPLV